MTEQEALALEHERLRNIKQYRCRKCGGTEYKIWGRKQPRRCCVACKKETAKRHIHKHRHAHKMRNHQWNKSEAGKRFHWEQKILHQYGITADEYDKMFSAQGGVCAICLERSIRERLSVDHSHGTQQIRGLLCRRCNLWLSRVAGDVAFLGRAVDYIQDPPAVQSIGLRMARNPRRGGRIAALKAVGAVE